MTDTLKLDYWEECLAQSFEEHGITATREQIRAVADDVEGGRECMDMAFYVPENPVHEELARTKRELQKERDKVVCPDCRGRGRLVYASGDRSVDTQCDKCSGEGYYIPR
jgi:hypothetical protein